MTARAIAPLPLDMQERVLSDPLGNRADGMVVSTAWCVRSACTQSDGRRRLSRGRTASWNPSLHSTSSRHPGPDRRLRARG
jgi:hypothetical protein